MIGKNLLRSGVLCLTTLLLCASELYSQQTIYWTRDYVRDDAGISIAVASSGVTGPGVPANLDAETINTGRIDLKWASTSAFLKFEVWRRTSGSFTKIGESTVPSYSDTTVSADTTYVYTVNSVSAGLVASGASSIAVATTVIFTDDPGTPGVTAIKALHLTELRTATNAMRATAGLSAASWTDAALSGATVKAVHISELRSALSAAITALGFTAPTFADPTLTPTSTPIRLQHIHQLRSYVK